MHASERKWWEMRCFDREQAQEWVKTAQSITLDNLGSLVARANDLDGAASWLPTDEAEDVRAAAVKIREMIVLGREVESILACANDRRRDREAAQRDEAALYAAPDMKIEMR